MHLGGQSISVAHGKRAVLLAPERPVTVRMPAGFKGRSLTVARAALEAHFAMLTGHVPREAMLFEPELDLTKGGGATLHGLVRLLREEIERAMEAQGGGRPNVAICRPCSSGPVPTSRAR